LKKKCVYVRNRKAAFIGCAKRTVVDMGRRGRSKTTIEDTPMSLYYHFSQLRLRGSWNPRNRGMGNQVTAQRLKLAVTIMCRSVKLESHGPPSSPTLNRGTQMQHAYNINFYDRSFVSIPAPPLRYLPSLFDRWLNRAFRRSYSIEAAIFTQC
jgi:hypothetical protein